MSIKPEDKIRETYKGKIGKLLREIEAHATMTASKRELVDRLISTATAMGYETFSAQAGGYKISAIGDSYLYDVPVSKKGALEPFRGSRVRIMCVGSGSQASRVFMAGKS